MLKMLNESTLAEMYAKCVQVLEEAGVNFDTEESRELFRKAGAIVEGNNVKIPAALLEKCLQLMPPADNTITERRVAATSPFGNVPVILDHETDEIRRVKINDAILMYQLTQTSDLYECCNISTLDPTDIEVEESYVAQIAMALKYTDKWFSNGARATAGNSLNGDIYSSARRALHLIRDFYGTYDEPVMTQFICPMSPLQYDVECLQNLNATLDEGQMIGFSPCSLPVMTSPGSIVGTAIHDFALSLAGIVYIQLYAPGTPVSLSNATGMTDMKAMQPAYASPEAMLIQSVFYELCLYKNIGSGFCGTLSDATKVDFQAGVESLLTTLLPYQYVDVGTIWCYPGLMCAWRCGSFEKTILDEEVMRYVNRALHPIDTSIESNLIQLMKDAKIGNTFMKGRTPKEYRRDVYLTRMFSKAGLSQGLDPLKTDIHAMVRKELADRVNSYILPERTGDQQKLLNQYLPQVCKY